MLILKSQTSIVMITRFLIFLLVPTFTLAQVNLNQGLVAHWDFNGNANDVSGNNNNGTVYGATLTTGALGLPNTAYYFNGTSDYIQVPNSPGLNTLPTDSFSICTLIKVKSFYSGPCHGNSIIDKGNSDYIAGWYTLRFSDAYSTTFLNCSTPVNIFQQNYSLECFSQAPLPGTYNPVIDTSLWDCVIATYDGDSTRLYVNGVLKQTFDVTGPMGTNTHDLFIGRKNSAQYPYWVNGKIDDIRIYNRVLNTQEIFALCGCNSAPPISNLITTNDTSVCSSGPIQLNTNQNIDSNSIFYWSPTVSLSDSTSLNPVASPAATTTYYFNLLHKGCNLVENGDFEAGNVGFVSQYTYAPVNLNQAEYFVGVNPQAWNGALGVFGDHTTGNGNMLLVNGAPVPNTSVWCKTVSVSPNTDYAFSAWIQNVNTWGLNSNPPVLQFSINGILLGNPFNTTTIAGIWQQFYDTWNSGPNTSASICIVNQNTIAAGNDFAIDDISLAPYSVLKDSVLISIQPPPQISVSPNAIICSGDTLQLTASGASGYSWSPTTFLSNSFISSPTANPTASTIYTVTGTDNFGCTGTNSVQIIVNPIPIITAISSPPIICSGENTTLVGSGGISYIWSGGVVNGQSFSPPSSSTYTVTGIDANGCTNTSTASITVIEELPVIVTPGDTTICVGDSVQLNAQGATSYTWTTLVGLNTYNGPIVWANPIVSSTYTVTGVDVNGCSNTATADVKVLSGIEITVSKNRDAECNLDLVQLMASGAQNYSWTPSNLLSNPQNAITNANVLETTTFYVTGNTGSCVDIDSITVFKFDNDETAIFVPNAFTPNGDGLNDCLRVRHNANFKEFYLAIYNRWGQKIYESDNPNACWDGEYNNEKLLAGVYFYYIHAVSICGDVLLKGDISLLR